MQLARRIRGHSHLHRYQYDNDRPSIIKPPTTNDASNPVIVVPPLNNSNNAINNETSGSLNTNGSEPFFPSVI